MKTSIITPSHNPKYLKELEESILANSYQDREWIILLNNGAEYKTKDERIKIYTYPGESKSVGQLKKYACGLATGEIIVEIDHDDLITTDCLEEIVKAFQEDGIGFVYSDNAKLGKFTPYGKQYGREHKMVEWNGQELYCMKSQPMYPGRFGYIRYMPDHVRSWKKDVYDLVGGHNEELDVCDDQDLMHRLYLVTKFKHIDRCLYIYRIDGDNTWLQRNAKIQSLTREIYEQNIFKLAERYAELTGGKKIDLCGGFNKPTGYTSIDLENGDITADLNEGIPLPDNSCAIVRAVDTLEHLKDKQFIMKEIHRVLMPGGLFISITPSTDGRGAFQDPTHISFRNENSFWYWTREQSKYIRNTDTKFRECLLKTYYPSKWHKENNISYVRADLEKLF